MFAYVLAVMAAFLFAAATAVQHRAARIGPEISGSAKNQTRAVRAIVRNPLWLIGVLADGGGFICQAFALTKGDLAVVQPLLVTGLLFALPLAAWLESRKLAKSEFFWGALVVICLGVFLGLANPGGGDSTIDNGPAVIACLVSVSAGVICVLIARSPTESVRAAALGVLTGVLFALSAALIKAVGTQVADDLDGILTNWPIYALLVIGPAGLAINQLAFQAGPLSASLPALTAVDPLVSIPLGVFLFDEHLHGGIVSALLQAVTLIVLTVAIAKLSEVKDQSNLLQA